LPKTVNSYTLFHWSRDRIYFDDETVFRYVRCLVQLTIDILTECKSSDMFGYS